MMMEDDDEEEEDNDKEADDDGDDEEDADDDDLYMVRVRLSQKTEEKTNNQNQPRLSLASQGSFAILPMFLYLYEEGLDNKEMVMMNL